MQQWWLHRPEISMEEMAAVATAALVLAFAPLLVAWVERRRRRTMALRAAATPTFGMPAVMEGIPSLVSTLASPPAVEVSPKALPVQVEGLAVDPADSPGDVSSEPLPSPVAPLAEPVAGPVPAEIVAPVLAAPAPEARPVPDPQPEGMAVGSEKVEADPALSEIATPPPVAASAPGVEAAVATAIGGAGEEFSVESAVARRSVLEAPQPCLAGRHPCRLGDLREARLPDWPPAGVRTEARAWRLWEEGAHLLAVFGSDLRSIMLATPAPIASFAFGSVETDGELYRIGFFLFEDLWPGGSRDSEARAIFEIHPREGIRRSWIETR